jgi:hypothetical protein
MTQGHGQLINSVFRGLGLRTENASVRLSGAGLSAVKDAARNLGANLATCLDEDGNATVSPVKIIWHGMGKRSLISIPLAKNNSNIEEWTELEISSEELRLIRGNTSICHDLKSQVFFESNSADITQEFQLTDLINDATKSIKEIQAMPCVIPRKNNLPEECNWRLIRIIASGSADPMPKSDGGNEGLAKLRAQRIVDTINGNSELKTLLDLEKDLTLETASLGSRASLQKACPFSGNKAALQECHASSRNVKVRLLFKARKKVSSNSNTDSTQIKK